MCGNKFSDLCSNVLTNMPRGYLKRYQKEVGRKSARGGSSHFSFCTHNCSFCRCWKKNSSGFHQYTFPEIDFTVQQKRKNSRNELKKEAHKDPIMYPTGECPICFAEGPVVPINSGNGLVAGCCSWHDAACFKCLQRIYIIDAQNDVSNYPLRCYHPQCQNQIRWGQLHKHKLIRSKEENDAYHEMMDKARIASNCA